MFFFVANFGWYTTLGWPRDGVSTGFCNEGGQGHLWSRYDWTVGCHGIDSTASNGVETSLAMAKSSGSDGRVGKTPAWEVFWMLIWGPKSGVEMGWVFGWRGEMAWMIWRVQLPIPRCARLPIESSCCVHDLSKGETVKLTIQLFLVDT